MSASVRSARGQSRISGPMSQSSNVRAGKIASQIRIASFQRGGPIRMGGAGGSVEGGSRSWFTAVGGHDLNTPAPLKLDPLAVVVSDRFRDAYVGANSVEHDAIRTPRRQAGREAEGGLSSG